MKKLTKIIAATAISVGLLIGGAATADAANYKSAPGNSANYR